MSYILDALKKAERERYNARVPTLRTMHGAPPRRRPRWPFYLAGVVIVANVVVGVMFFRGPRPLVGDTVVVSAVPPAAPESATRVTPPVPTPPAASPAPPPSPSGSATAALPPSPPAPPAGETRPAPRATARPSVPPAPAAPSPEITAPARVTPDTRPPGLTGTPPDPLRERTSGTAGERVPRGTTSRARVDTPGGEPARPTPPAVAVAPAASASAPPSAAAAPRFRADAAPAGTRPVAPSAAGAKASGPLSTLAEMPAAFQAAVPKLRVQVLVYDGNEAGAWIFINNRKYVVGDRLGDDITVERITEDGAILGFEGRRYLLKQ